MARTWRAGGGQLVLCPASTLSSVNIPEPSCRDPYPQAEPTSSPRWQPMTAISQLSGTCPVEPRFPCPSLHTWGGHAYGALLSSSGHPRMATSSRCRTGESLKDRLQGAPDVPTRWLSDTGLSSIAPLYRWEN